ncbi:SDR family NAD(P)-dependent oxidoreductase [Actinoplanes sp. CA-030573]|uniref:SDR family NAD(P)-dependent oxidoreductase n=1 Tax=Actinoplanes sp. CA-030573 TaxID=3239898 RepID=UPI003D93A97F
MSNRFAVVTGAGGDIGACCARRLAASGDLVLCVDRDLGRAETTAAAITGDGHRARAIRADAGAADFAQTVAAQAAAAGVVTAVVHALAYEEHTPADRLSSDSLELSLRVGPIAAFTLFQTLLTAGHLADGSALTVIGSLHASRAFAGCLGYNAAHGALAQVVRTLAHEWAGRGIRVNAVVPGWIHTGGEETLYGRELLIRVGGKLPLRRLGTPDDIADAVAFVSSARAGYISGAFLTVDGALDVSLARLPEESA